MGLNRRTLLATGAASAFAGPALAQRVQAVALATTTNGPVRGLQADGVQVFKGVRYGAPPVGPLRFKAPVKPQAWTAPAEATRFGPPAIQMPAPNNIAPPTTDLSRSFVDVFPIRQETAADSEDCLFLNVWTPATDGKRRPVMVWLHGGGFAYGSGAWPMYDGTNLARRGDVVVVTVNHRLNALGYLHLAELAGPAYAESGNAGMLDLVLALQWVRDNARAFGGDPRNVTVFGESGGGVKVGNLMAMPAARGLFHKAVVQSGPGLTGVPAASATQTARAILAELKIDPKDAAALQRVPAEDLVKAAYAVQSKLPPGGGQRFLGPVVDGRVLPRDPFTPTASPLGRDIPLMVGANKDEMTLFVASEPWFGRLTEEQLTERAAAMPKGAATLAALRASRPGYSPSHYLAALMSWGGILGGSVTLADRKAAQGGAPVYAYRLDWETPVGGGVLKSPHTLEIPLVFDTVESNRPLVGPGEAPVQLARLMSDSWIAFARTGNPNTKALPNWPRYDPVRRPTMVFDVPPRVVNDPEASVRIAMQS